MKIDLKVYGTAPNGALLVSADEVNSAVQGLIDEIAKLRQVAADRTKEAELAKRVANEFQQLNAELVVQAEQLKVLLLQQAGVVMKNSYPMPDKEDRAWSKAKAAIDFCNKTQSQCLAEVKAQAVKEFDEFIYETFPQEGVNFDTYGACFEMFVDKLNQQAKAGQ